MCRSFLVLTVLLFLMISVVHAQDIVEPDLLTSTPTFNGLDWQYIGSLSASTPTKPGITFAYNANEDGAPVPFLLTLNWSTAVVTLRPAAAPTPFLPPCTCVNSGGGECGGHPMQIEAAMLPSPLPVDTCYFIPSGIGRREVQILSGTVLSPGFGFAIGDPGMAGTIPTVVGDPTWTTANFASDTTLAGTRVTVSPEDPRSSRLLFVLDRSGSMAWTSRPHVPGCNPRSPPGGNPACGPSRWELLKASVDAVLAVGQTYGFDTPVVLPAGNRDPAQVGAVTFGGMVDAVTDVLSLSTFSVAGISAWLNAKMPSGWTSIGAGLQALLDEGLVQVGLDDREVVLLFSDGEQNRPPCVSYDVTADQVNLLTGGRTCDDSTTLTPYGLSNESALCPFLMRFDDPTGTDFEFFQEIANGRCNGLAYTSTFGGWTPDVGAASSSELQGQLQGYFLQVLFRALYGDKLELAGDFAVEAGGSQSFYIGAQDSHFTLLIRWNENQNQAADELQITLNKDGEQLRYFGDQIVDSRLKHSVRREGPGYVSLSVRGPLCGADGRGELSQYSCVSLQGLWEVSVRGFNADPIEHTVHVISDNPVLASEFEVEQADPGVGNPVDLRAVFTEVNVPADISRASVQAIIRGPGLGLGNVLSDSEIEPSPPINVDSASPAGRKALAMLDPDFPDARAALIQAISLVGEEIVELNENQGQFLGTFTPNFEGIYDIRFVADLETALNGRITRTWRRTLYVGVVPEEDGFEVLAVARSEACPDRFRVCQMIRIRPVDSQGNRVGPGKSRLFLPVGAVDPKARVQLLTAADAPELDGTYDLTYGYRSIKPFNPLVTFRGTSARLQADLGDPPIEPDMGMMGDMRVPDMGGQGGMGDGGGGCCSQCQQSETPLPEHAAFLFMILFGLRRRRR